jgi:hypothetical protein
MTKFDFSPSSTFFNGVTIYACLVYHIHIYYIQIRLYLMIGNKNIKLLMIPRVM